MFARSRVLDTAVAGKLIGLLPVLAASLAIALTGDASEPTVRLAGFAERERQVD